MRERDVRPAVTESPGRGSETLDKYTCWINGNPNRGERFLPLVDPSTGEPFALAEAADERVVDEALESAARAFVAWRRRSAADRAGVLHRIAGTLGERSDEFAAALSLEAGKPFQAALDEVRSTATLFDYYAEEGLRLTGEIPLLGYPREHVLVVREPVGVAAAVTPFNYPLSTLACKAAPALAAGCAVVAKPDEHTPVCTIMLARAAMDAGLPPGAFNVVLGPGPEAGHFLVRHRIPRVVTFTGSGKVGKLIQAESARYARKVILELGGQSPAIIRADADWRQALPQIIRQAYKNCGQYCYRISRVYAEEGIFEAFLAALTEEVARLRVGPASEPWTEIGPLNNADILARVESQVARAVADGARLVLGGARPKEPAGGFYYLPTILAEDSAALPVATEEIFGPVLIVSPFRDAEETIRLCNATPYGLAAYLFTGNLGEGLHWAKELEVGSVWVNRVHGAYHEAPFGGRKESGLGRERSRFGLEEFTELKTIYVSY